MNPKKYVQSIFKQPTVFCFFFLFVVLFVQRNPLKIFGYQGASSGHRRASKLGLNHSHTHKQAKEGFLQVSGQFLTFRAIALNKNIATRVFVIALKSPCNGKSTVEVLANRPGTAP